MQVQCGNSDNPERLSEFFLYEFLIKQPKLFYSAASKAACGAAEKTKSIRFLLPFYQK